jgi:hypothetical protein
MHRDGLLIVVTKSAFNVVRNAVSEPRTDSKVGEIFQDDLIEPAGILYVARVSDARQHDLACIWDLLQGVGDHVEIWQVALTDNDQCWRTDLLSAPSRRRVGVTYWIGVGQVPS